MNITSQHHASFKTLIAEFNNIKINALSGNAIVEVAGIPSWMLCFSSGRLAGISGGLDAIDRWRRNLALASLNAPLERLVRSTNHQEIFLNSNQLAQSCAAQEIVFDIIQFSQQKGDRLSYQFMPTSGRNDRVQSVLPLLEIQPILSAAIHSWQEWGKYGLANYAPSLFLKIQKSVIADFDDDKDLQYLLESIDGTKSLRSIAIQHQKKLIDVGASLLPLLKSGQILLSPVKQSSTEQNLDVNAIDDLDLDLVEVSLPDLSLAQRSNPNPSPLIACIDDSILVCKNLEKIITEHGCRFLGIQDPLVIMPNLIRNKPDLIFLDLVMPIANGYEVCEQIRRTPSLASIPIIILTGHDGFVDRVRSKFAGVNGFLGKPIEPESIVKTIDKYLGKKQAHKPIDNGRRFVNSEPINKANQRVLVIDDDRSIREVVSMCLNKLKNWDVVAVGSGQEGLDEIHAKNPDIIILDVMMPAMDGMAFLRKLRSNPETKLIPVVLLTANRYLPDKELLTELGVVETISKPFLPIDLVRHIDRALIKE